MHYSRRIWCCPFYTSDEKFTVHCEGGNRFRVKNKRIFSAHADRYCGNAKGWKDCPTAAALEELYRTNGGGKTDDWT